MAIVGPAPQRLGGEVVNELYLNTPAAPTPAAAPLFDVSRETTEMAGTYPNGARSMLITELAAEQHDSELKAKHEAAARAASAAARERRADVRAESRRGVTAATAPQCITVQDAIRTLLEHIGEDAARDGLLDTPARVAKAWREMTVGYTQEPAEILARTFDVPCEDEPVILRNIPFHSNCEHHMLPFHGTATVAYIPGGRVVGISKLARLVHCFARRLQVQERLTKQIADAVEEHLDAAGVAVVISAHHSCMGCRGVGTPQTEMITTAFRGVLKADPARRAELLALQS